MITQTQINKLQGYQESRQKTRNQVTGRIEHNQSLRDILQELADAEAEWDSAMNEVLILRSMR